MKIKPFVRAFWLSIGLLITMSFAASAQSPFQSSDYRLSFYVSILGENCDYEYVDLDYVPNVPNKVCYGWFAYTGVSSKELNFTEVVKYPSAPRTIYLGGETTATLDVTPDGSTSILRNAEVPDDGYVGNGWCITDGDPSGSHQMDISIDGEHFGSITFDLADWDGSTPRLRADQERYGDFGSCFVAHHMQVPRFTHLSQLAAPQRYARSN